MAGPVRRTICPISVEYRNMEPHAAAGRPITMTTLAALAGDTDAASPAAGPAVVATWDSNLERWYEDEMPDAIRVAYLMTGQRALAEDIAQDAFLRVAARIRRLRDPAAFRSYLRRAVVNATNSHFRRERVSRRYLEKEGAAPTARPDGPDIETRDAIATALARLPHRQRATVVCRYYLDLTEQDTADALGVRPGTVKSSLSRGLAALRVHLFDHDISRHDHVDSDHVDSDTIPSRDPATGSPSARPTKEPRHE